MLYYLIKTVSKLKASLLLELFNELMILFTSVASVGNRLKTRSVVVTGAMSNSFSLKLLPNLLTDSRKYWLKIVAIEDLS